MQQSYSLFPLQMTAIFCIPFLTLKYAIFSDLRSCKSTTNFPSINVTLADEIEKLHSLVARELTRDSRNKNNEKSVRAKKTCT